MPVWGWVADKTGKHKVVLLSLMALAAVLRVLMLYVSESVPLLLAVLFLSDFFGMAIESMCDSTCLEMLDDPLLYPKQRLWGAIGWGWIGAPLAGMVIETRGLAPAFYIHAALVALTMIVILHFNVHAPKSNGRIVEVAWVMFRDRRTFLFFMATMVLGQGFGAIFTFLFVLLADLGDKGAVMGLSLLVTCLTEVPIFFVADKIINSIGMIHSYIACTLLMAVRLTFFSFMHNPWLVLIVEVRCPHFLLLLLPPFFLSPLSFFNFPSFSSFHLAIPFPSSSTPSPSLSASDPSLQRLQGIHGVTFGVMWATGVTYCRKIAPKGLGATMQGWYTGWTFGFSMGSGSLIAGALASRFGLPTMFLILGLVSGATGAFMLVGNSLGMLGEANDEEKSFYSQFDDGNGEKVAKEKNVEMREVTVEQNGLQEQDETCEVEANKAGQEA